MIWSPADLQNREYAYKVGNMSDLFMYNDKKLETWEIYLKN